MADVDALVKPGATTKQQKKQDGQRKLPRPIVFWSINERTAYRRNRVVQTRLNMIIHDIATQCETSRKNIRYEAHKFRQKSAKYYSHPSAVTKDFQGGVSVVNIAPPDWINKNSQNRELKHKQNHDSDSDSDGDDVVNSGTLFSPRKTGIITRPKTPSVKFSMFKQVHKVEDDLKIDDLEIANQTINNATTRDLHTRSVSAQQYRDIPDLPGQSTKRQQSAFPALRSRSDAVNENYKEFQNSKNKIENLQKDVKMLRSDTFFDKSKAAYQLRQDLRKRAKLRKQGVKSEVFTLQDALNMEKEKCVKSRDKVLDYISRIEATKFNERNKINKWTKTEIENQLHI